jgi:hypothetical protein
MSETSNIVRGSSTRPPSLVPPAPPGSSPADGPGTLWFRSDGDLIPAGEYLVEIWPAGATLAYRAERGDVWGPSVVEL